jgi:hypothetical protein
MPMFCALAALGAGQFVIKAEDIDPALAQGFAALKQAASFTAQRADDLRNDWQPHLQLWVGVKATSGKKQTLSFVQLTTLQPPTTNTVGGLWQPVLRTNDWSWPSSTNKNAALSRAQYITPGYPVRVRVFDASGRPRKEGQTPMAWGMVTNGLLDMCRLSLELFPAQSKAKPTAVAGDELSQVDRDRLMRALGGGFLWMIGMFGDLQTVPSVADIWKQAQYAVRMPSAWTMASVLFTGFTLELEPRLTEVSLAGPALTNNAERVYLLPMDLKCNGKILSRVQITVGPARGAEMLLEGIRSVHALHPARPQHEFLAQVLATGSGLD